MAASAVTIRSASHPLGFIPPYPCRQAAPVAAPQERAEHISTLGWDEAQCENSS